MAAILMINANKVVFIIALNNDSVIHIPVKYELLGLFVVHVEETFLLVQTAHLCSKFSPCRYEQAMRPGMN